MKVTVNDIPKKEETFPFLVKGISGSVYLVHKEYDYKPDGHNAVILPSGRSVHCSYDKSSYTRIYSVTLES